MKYQKLLILLPCHSLEDFPTHYEGSEADGLLAGWSALWHPALIAAVERMPIWSRVDSPPDNLAQHLLVIPAVSTPQLPTGLIQRAGEQGAIVIQNETDRAQIVHAALASLDGGDGGVDPELAADFLALGYCFLQVELLTRQMRYASNLDETYFSGQLVAAARAAVSHDQETARQKLTACFDVLAQERDHFYSVDVYLLDVTLLAPTTLGASLQQELASPTPINWLAQGEILARIQQEKPGTFEQLQEARNQGRLGIVTGEYVERRLSLLPAESILSELSRNRELVLQWFDQPPLVYGRHRYGPTPGLPQLLQKLGYKGALHATFEEGRVPDGGQVKVRWESKDGSGVDAIARLPLNANRPETFLALAAKMSESMDMDHVATVCLAHWAGQVSPWYHDLKRISRFGSVLGRFVTVEKYFQDTDYPGQVERFEVEHYKSPYLKQAVVRKQADPISSCVRFWQRRAKAEAVQALQTLTQLITGDVTDDDGTWLKQVDESDERVDQTALDARLDQQLTAVREALADCITKTGEPRAAGYLVLNPTSFVRRVLVEVDELAELPQVVKPVYAAAEMNGQRLVVADVPPMGYVHLTAGRPREPEKRPPPNLAEEQMLRNEYMEVNFDPTTGSIRSIHDYQSRTNRLSQQLAMRLSSGRGEGPSYSVMAAESVEITAASPVLGEMTSRGRLLDRQGKPLASFRQVTRLRRGSRVLELEIELDPQQEPQAEPWNSYYANRIAWQDEASDLYQTVNGFRYKTDGKRLEAPQFLEVESEKNRTTLFCGGLPFHRRQGMRMLDTLLIVRGERARQFRLGIGVDVPYPIHEAQHFLTDPLVERLEGRQPSGAASAWLFHLDAKTVSVTFWQPLQEEGRIVGFRARLLEGRGRSVRAKLSAFREVASARLRDFCGNPLGECTIKDGAVSISLAAHEWVEVEARLRS